MTSLGHGISYKSQVYKKTTQRSRKAPKVVGASKIASKSTVKTMIAKAISQVVETKYFDRFSWDINDTTHSVYGYTTVTYPTTDGYNYGCRYTTLNTSDMRDTSDGGSNTVDSGFGALTRGNDNIGNLIGDSILCKNIRVKMEAYKNSTSGFPNVRCLVVQEGEVPDREDVIQMPDFNEFLMNTYQYSPDFIGFKPVSLLAKLKNYKILKDFRIDFSNVSSPTFTKYRSFVIPVNKKLMYAQTGTGKMYVAKNRIFMLFIGEEPDATKLTHIKWQSRMTFQDA